MTRHCFWRCFAASCAPYGRLQANISPFGRQWYCICYSDDFIPTIPTPFNTSSEYNPFFVWVSPIPWVGTHYAGWHPFRVLTPTDVLYHRDAVLFCRQLRSLWSLTSGYEWSRPTGGSGMYLAFSFQLYAFSSAKRSIMHYELCIMNYAL